MQQAPGYNEQLFFHLFDHCKQDPLYLMGILCSQKLNFKINFDFLVMSVNFQPMRSRCFYLGSLISFDLWCKLKANIL